MPRFRAIPLLRARQLSENEELVQVKETRPKRRARNGEKDESKYFLSYGDMLANILQAKGNSVPSSNSLDTPPVATDPFSGMARNFTIVDAPQKLMSRDANAYTDLPTDIHFTIFDMLVGNKTVTVNFYLHTDNTIRTLNGPDFGTFDPRTTKFLIDTSGAPTNHFKSAVAKLELNVMRADLIKLTTPPVHRSTLRFLTISIRSQWAFLNLIDNAVEFLNLECLEIIYDRRHSGFSYAYKEADSNAFHDLFWHSFWERSMLCHPGKSCTGCVNCILHINRSPEACPWC
ncbi:hypothetical protein BJ878DRAFT_479041 [Calycina marina]|uniref:Uncharacterized protein n=1 Tax=Calycina marina TaxID=1763456 RepID=A0A9P8CFX6_9HELO|nr:hypothetical protein BJ878DRAFT_479041 [Calycina marina]